MDLNIKATATQNADGSTTISVPAQSFKIPAAAPAKVQISAQMPNGQVGVPYVGQLTGSGGKPPYSYSFSPALPGGLALNQQTGAVSGSPSAAVNYTGTAACVDANKQGATAQISFAIAGAVQPPPPPPGKPSIGGLQDGETMPSGGDANA